MLDVISMAKPNFFVANSFLGGRAPLADETSCAAGLFQSAGFAPRLAEMRILRRAADAAMLT